MTRDYAPLGAPSDLPGDPVGIHHLAVRYLETADEIVATANRLRRLSSTTDTVWKGLAGQRFLDKARDLSERIQKAETRYRDTGTALHDFADEIEHAQCAAAAAARDARDAEEDIAANAVRPGDDELLCEDDYAVFLRARRHALVREARERLRRAGNAFAAARADYRQAETRAHDRIVTAARTDGLRDSWVYRNWKAIRKIFEVITIVLLVVTVICLAVLAVAAILSTGGAVLALAVLGVVGKVSAVVSLLSLATHAIGAANGVEVSKWDVALDVIGLLSFGIGKVAAARVARLASRAKLAKPIGERVVRTRVRFDTRAIRARGAADLARATTLPPAMRAQRLWAAVLLRDNPDDLMRLAALARSTPSLRPLLAEGVGWATVGASVQLGSDALSLTGLAGDGGEADAAAEDITRQVHRHLMSVP